MGASICTESWRQCVSAYHDGLVIGQERHAIEAHLRTCDSCQALLASYDQLYRRLRVMPGFDGRLAVVRTLPSRRAKPTMTWNGRVIPVSHHERHNRWSGGIAAFLLVVIVMIAIITSKGAITTEPASSPPLSIAAAPTIAPTFGPLTVNGVTCANGGNNLLQPYAYIDANSVIWKVPGCNKATQLAVAHIGSARLGSWSPDGTWFTVFGPSSPAGGTLYVVNATTGVLKQVNVAGATATLVNAALWVDNATLVVQTPTVLRKVNIATSTSTSLNINDAKRIELHNGMLFYSTSAAKVVWHDLITGNDVTVLTLDKPDDAWDVSSDGSYIACVHTVGAVATVAYQQLEGTTANAIFTVPTAMTVQELRFSPDSSHIVALLTGSNQQNSEIAVASFTDSTPALYPSLGTFTWRADSRAVIAEPTAPGTTPQLIDINTGAQIALPTQTASYIWQTGS